MNSMGVFKRGKEQIYYSSAKKNYTTNYILTIYNKKLKLIYNTKQQNIYIHTTYMCKL